jgi:hypothetical protein
LVYWGRPVKQQERIQDATTRLNTVTAEIAGEQPIIDQVKQSIQQNRDQWNKNNCFTPKN